MHILKTIDVLLIVAMLGAATWTFAGKYRAEAMEHEVTLIDRKITLERETIKLLEADWSLLNQPNRLEQLADAFTDDLKLRPTQPEQIVGADQLPAPAVVIEPDPEAKAGETFASAERARAR